jgi:hypothetical protein
MPMRRTTLMAFCLLLAPEGRAGLILLSDNRSVSVSGFARGIDGSQNYTNTLSPPSPFSPFNGNVAGSADWIDTTHWPGYPPGFSHADSQCSQVSSFTPYGFSVHSILLGQSWIAPWTPPGCDAGAFGSSVFEITFSVDTPEMFSLIGSVQRVNANIALSLTSYHHGDIIEPPAVYPFAYSGVLQPDTYVLQFDQNFQTVADPLGDVRSVDATLDFEIAAVPEPSSLSLGLLAVAFSLRALRNSRRPIGVESDAAQNSAGR